MPIWLQVFYIIFSGVILVWAGWITRLLLKHERLFEQVMERCHGREMWIRSIENDTDATSETIKRMDRNIVRLGMKSGLDKGELESGQ